MYECVAIDSSTPFMQALGSVCVQAYLLINLMETQLDARSATVTAFEAGNHQLIVPLLQSAPLCRQRFDSRLYHFHEP
jgi:hypothetical protein